VNLSQVKPSERLFIGLTSPGRAKSKVIRRIKRLVECHTGPEKTVIVNTDGWVEGDEAILYKRQMLDELQPDIALGIGGNEISSIFQTGNRTTLLVGSPDTIRERTRFDRKELRSLGYRKYLAGASLRTLHIDGTRLRYCLAPNDLDMENIQRLQLKNMKDAIVGLLNSEGFLEEIGVLKDLSPSTKKVRVWSRISGTPSKIEIGEVRLNNEGRELGHLGPP
jgi:polynucleotide 5'-kinase involved in rRNA processing